MNYPIIICVAILLHIIWACGLVIEPNAIKATGLHTLLLIAHNSSTAALIFAVIAVLAILGLVVTVRVARVLLILPQQAVLWFSAVGPINAMLLGQFADGVQRTHWFLIVDQAPLVLLALGHTAALLILAGKGHA